MAEALKFSDIIRREFYGKTKLKGVYVSAEDYNLDVSRHILEKEGYKLKYDTLCKQIAAGLGLLVANNKVDSEPIDISNLIKQ